MNIIEDLQDSRHYMNILTARVFKSRSSLKKCDQFIYFIDGEIEFQEY